MERIRCTKCGAEIVDYNPAAKVIKCNRMGCGASFIMSQALGFANVEEIFAKNITNLRELMGESANKRDSDKLRTYSMEIKKMIPDDLMANFYEKLALKLKGDPREYEEFFKAVPAGTKEDCRAMARLAIRFLEYREFDIVASFIDSSNFNESEKNLLKTEFDNAAGIIRNKVNDSDAWSRDIFICYGGKNVSIAENLYDILRKDGYSCWIASKNMPEKTDNYWKTIFKMIEKCKIFLVVSSEETMLRQDPRREVEKAMDLGKARIEYKIDNIEHTTLFKEFFDGLQWINASTNQEKAVKELKKRVYRMLSNKKETKKDDSIKEKKEDIVTKIQKKEYENLKQDHAVNPNDKKIRSLQMIRSLFVWLAILGVLFIFGAVNANNDDMIFIGAGFTFYFVIIWLALNDYIKKKLNAPPPSEEQINNKKHSVSYALGFVSFVFALSGILGFGASVLNNSSISMYLFFLCFSAVGGILVWKSLKIKFTLFNLIAIVFVLTGLLSQLLFYTELVPRELFKIIAEWFVYMFGGEFFSTSLM